MKTLKRSLAGLLILIGFQLLAATNGEDSARITAHNAGIAPVTSVYVELGGKFMNSLNLDFRIKENFAFSVGTGVWYDREEYTQYLFTPSVGACYLAGRRHRMELGLGTGPFLSTRKGFASLMIYGNIGYRYQQKKGLFFRAGFTPFMAIPVNGKSRFMAPPWAGISLGYCL
jgi:uncharacterized membrane protein YbjE (DUF340 family)